MPQIIHFRDKCIGCNSCVEHSPEFWKMSDKDGKSILLRSIEKKETFVLKVNSIEAEDNKKAAKDCPVNIIRII